MTRAGMNALHGRLAEWLRSNIDADHVELSPEYDRPTNGYNSDTLIMDAVVERSGTCVHERFVVRRETFEPSVYPRQTAEVEPGIDIQYRVMAAIAKAAPDIPLAPLIGYESNPDVFGVPFFAMRYVAGQVLLDSPIYVREGFFADAEPQQRQMLINGGIDMLARLHSLDWEAAGLGWLVPSGVQPTTARQLQQWSDHAQVVLKGRRHPVLERAISWLRANPPVEGTPVLCWGDARPGNIMWRNFQPVCVTDFEAASIAPSGSDISWWLVFDRYVRHVTGGKRLDGEPTRDEQLARYQAASPHPVDDPGWHEVFAAARFTTMTVEGIDILARRAQDLRNTPEWRDKPMRAGDRLVAEGQFLLLPDTTEWRDNPMSAILEELLDET